MYQLKSLFNFYINASIHIAFAAISLVYVTTFELDSKPDIKLNLFVFFATITAYNFVKYFGVDRHHFKHRAKNLNLILWLSIVSAIVAFYFATALKNKSLWILFLSGIMTLLYALPKTPFRIFKLDIINLRKVAGLKVYMVVLVWSIVTFLLPLFELEIVLDSRAFISFVQRCMILIVLILPFEIRDMQFDSFRLETIPQKIGVKKTKLFGFVLVAMIALLEYVKPENTGVYKIGLLIILMISGIFLRFTEKDSPRNFTAFWVESIPLFWWGLLMFLQLLLNR